MTYQKPLPDTSRCNAPFFDACKENRLVAQKCDATGRFFFPPAPVSPYTRSKGWSWADLSGKGRVASFVVMHQKYFSGFADEVPYPVAEVELEEGIRLLTNIVELDAANIEIGMPVEVVFHKVTDDVTLPLFKPSA
ncbi:MAG: Zn-ribbon domain-containing OB-fold protein [Sphingomonadaceae bacterium]